MSGHSKWNSIKHKKAANDVKRGKILTKHSKILAVIGRNDPNPETNSSLRVAISNAKADGVPKDNILRILKKLSGEGKDSVIYSEQLYEGYAPEGIPFIALALTDNVNRTFPSVRTAVDKNGGKLGSPNSVKFMFDHLGIFLIKTNGQTEDEILEIVADCGADDFIYDREETEIVCQFDHLGKVRENLIVKNIEIIKSEPIFRAKEPKIVSDEKLAEKLEKFISIIEEAEDIDEVFCGFKIK